MSRLQAEEAVFHHKLLLLAVNRTAGAFSVYDAVRFAWLVSRRRVERIDFVLAVKDGLVEGVFVPEAWKEATVENFPEFGKTMNRRLAFVGRVAPPDIVSLYLKKRIPVGYTLAQSGIRYIDS